MQKIFMALIAAALFSCRAEEKKEAETNETSKTETRADLPYIATYSAKFEMGEPKHVEAIMKLWIQVYTV